MSTSKSPKAFPAIRARMGDWWYYLATLTFRDVAERVIEVPKIHDAKNLKDWIQREIKDKRRQQIADYLLRQPQRFFNAIVLGTYGGTPDWFPVEVSKGRVADVDLDDRVKTAFGLIQLSGKEELFAIDGQHRVVGIKRALECAGGADLADEEQAVIFVAHKKDEAGHQRTRRLFFTLNRYAKPVSDSDLIALSEDDAYAIATRRLLEEYRGLDTMRVTKAPNANFLPDDHSSFTTLVGLYSATTILARPAKSKERQRFKEGPVTSADVDHVLGIVNRFWDEVKKRTPAVRKVFDGKKPAEIVAQQRNPTNGGNLIFRPLGLRCFAEATRILTDRGHKLESAVEKLVAVGLELNEVPWVNVLWNPSTGRMAETKNAKLAINLFLHAVDEAPHPQKFELLAEYRKITGNPDAKLPA